MKEFGLGKDSGLEDIKSEQVVIWAFGKFFVPFVPPKTIVLYSDEIFQVLQNDFPGDQYMHL